MHSLFCFIKANGHLKEFGKERNKKLLCMKSYSEINTVNGKHVFFLNFSIYL